MKKFWKKIHGTCGRYEISNMGDVKSNIGKGRILKKRVGASGYPIVAISIDGKRKTQSLHRLLYTTFVGPIPEGMCINHRDGIKTNCTIDNLELCSYSENMKHAWKNNLIKRNYKMKTMLEKAKELGVSYTTLWRKGLTVLLLGLLVISCNKEEASFEAPILEQEIAIENGLDMDAFVDSIINNLSSFTGPEGNKLSSSSKGDDYVKVSLFMSDDVLYGILVDEDNDDLCFGDLTVSTVYLDNANPGVSLNIEDENENVVGSIKGNFTSFFSGVSNSISKLDSGYIPTSNVTFNDSNSATFTE